MSIVTIILFWKKAIAKLFLAAMVLALVFSILPMAIPFSALVLGMTSKGLVIDKNLNQNYRAQIVIYSVMTAPWLEIIEKRGILEKRIIKCTDYEIEDFNNEELGKSYEYSLFQELRICDAKDIVLISETYNTITLKLSYENQSRILTFDKSTHKVLQLKTHKQITTKQKL